MTKKSSSVWIRGLAGIAAVLAVISSASEARALTYCDILADAQSWVDNGVPYCQGPGGYYCTTGCSACYYDPLRGGACYRPDCSGYVSATWALDSPGLSTWGLCSYGEPVSIDQLRPGDALVDCDQHVMLFAGWIVPGATFYAYEESVCGTPAQLHTHDWGHLAGSYQPIRRPGVQECCTPKCAGLHCGEADACGGSCAIAPSAEICNGSDDDCDGLVDEDNVCFVYRRQFADFNGDGATDLLLQGANSQHDTFLLLANGQGGFLTAQRITTSFGMTINHWSAAYRNLFTGDFNGDGAADVLLQGINAENHTFLLLADGQGGFGPAQGITSSFGMTINHWSPGYRLLHVADFNGDGADDVLLQGRSPADDSFMLLGNRAAGFSPVQRITTSFGMTINHWSAMYRRLFAADFNGDSADDILLQGINAEHDTFLIASDGQGGFAAMRQVSSSFGMSTNHWSAAYRKLFTGDFDGDGRADLLLQGRDSLNDTFLLRANREGGFATSQRITGSFGMTINHWSAGYRRLYVDDFNGDGAADVLLQGQTAADNSFLLAADGTGGFAPVRTVTTSFGMTSNHWSAADRNVLTGDFNGDGRGDLLLQGGNETHDSFLLAANGAGGFASVQPITTSYGMTANHWSARDRHLTSGRATPRRRSVDGGTVPDAGEILDAGQSPVETDAGALADAGHHVEDPDAGHGPIDAGTRDAGTPHTGEDAGHNSTDLDAGHTAADASHARQDSGIVAHVDDDGGRTATDAGNDPGVTDVGGCVCVLPARAGQAGAAWLLIALGLGRRTGRARRREAHL